MTSLDWTYLAAGATLVFTAGAIIWSYVKAGKMIDEIKNKTGKKK